MNAIETLKAICEARAKATASLWRTGRQDMDSYHGHNGQPFSNIYATDPRAGRHLGQALPLVVATVEGEHLERDEEKANASLIALAGSVDWPALLAEVEQLNEFKKSWEMLCESMMPMAAHVGKPDPHVEALLDKLKENKRLLAEVERLQIAMDVIGSLGLGVVYGPDEQPDPTEGDPSAVVYEHEEGHFLLRVPEAAELLHKLIHVRAAEAAAKRKDGGK